MSLYLKYRPQDFQSVVGQQAVKQTLQSAVLNQSMSHAYLFCGPRGTGKTSMARILAKRLNCLNPVNNEPCNECEICTAIQKGRLVDLIEIDAASNRGIDEIRELREKIVFSPTQAKYKVYIIDEVHMLTKEAFNALLKTLEEPPSHAYFILATTEAHKIPETIISRCQQFSFQRISQADIADRLTEIAQKEEGEVERAGVELIAKLSHGGLRDAIGLLERMMLSGKVTAEVVAKHLGLTGIDHLERFLIALHQKNVVEALGILSEVKHQGKSIPQFVKEIISHMRDELHKNLTDKIQVAHLLNFIEIFLKAKQQLDLSPILELPVEMAIFKACDFETNPSEIQPVPKAQDGKKEVTQEKHEVKPLPNIPVSSQSQEVEIESAPGEAVNTGATKEVKTAEIHLDFETIQKNWPRVLDNIPTPFIKMSLSDAEPWEYTANGLTLHFKSTVFKDKIQQTNNQKEVQEALEKVYGRQITLKLELKKIELSEPKLKIENTSVNSSETANMAAEVFGIK